MLLNTSIEGCKLGKKNINIRYLFGYKIFSGKLAINGVAYCITSYVRTWKHPLARYGFVHRMHRPDLALSGACTV
jgi:hypothetical protein